MSKIIAIDPGKDKCGVILVNISLGIVLKGRIVESGRVIALISAWQKEHDFSTIFLGNGTTSIKWIEKLENYVNIQLLEEKGTTFRARYRYWELWPPSFWFRWFPKGLLIPPKELDAVAALVMLEDHIGKKILWPGPPIF